ncbi:MAG TPA: hypothetical protein VG270_13765, partial [Pseudolabrys sp.]|nr:hypothetical protein [Pseudolabrys sp.]
RPGTVARGWRFLAMWDNDTRILGLIVGGVVAVGAMLFILTGGDLGGKTTVTGDRDLPPIAMAGR